MEELQRPPNICSKICCVTSIIPWPISLLESVFSRCSELEIDEEKKRLIDEVGIVGALEIGFVHFFEQCKNAVAGNPLDKYVKSGESQVP
ncbi:hypothetical protein L1987_59836 [Smallanthus sonchifolius]|uniref:Uncharacterized protein n=1 Tax=Smallanthus sonchifolius TaxID=185202 RepID=A0ACB9D6L4_9ASTR|nr:hypothetical protein L1987_59836 [Smallanthus sonchifolius]